MAVEFGILGNVPSAGARFLEGQQAAQAEADRNMLRQMQMEQMVAQRENIMAQREQRVADVQARQAAQAQAARRQEFLSGLGSKMAEGGYKLDRPTLSSMLQFGLQNREDSLIKLATEGLKALDEEDLYQSESTRLGLPGAAAPAAPAAPVGAAPTVAPNAMMAGITREQVQNMLMSRNARIREQGKALASTLEKPQTYTPSADMQGYELAKSEGFKGTFFDYKRQLAEAGRAPSPPREPAARTIKVELADGSIGLMNLDTGEITPATMGGKTAKGKPSATFEKTRAQREQLQRDLNTAIFELKEATKEGGLIDQSTGSGVGRAVDIGARMVGKAMAGDIAIGKLKPIADIVLKMVPRFEGPQSDKDTQSYKEAAGQIADPTLPRAIRKEAAQTIIRLMENRKGQFVSTDMAAEGTTAGGGPSIQDQADAILRGGK